MSAHWKKKYRMRLFEKQQGRCAECGDDMLTVTAQPLSATFQRINPNKGYTGPNLKLVHQKCHGK